MSRPIGKFNHPAPILRLFEKTAPRLIDVGAVRTLFDRFGAQAATALNELAPVDMSSRLEQIEQGPAGALLRADPGVVTVGGTIAEWGAPAYLRLDEMILFRLLDAMYGGDPSRRPVTPVRPLTGLERELAVQLASAIMAKLREVLSGLCPFSFQAARIVDTDAAAEAIGNSAGVLLGMSLGEAGERISIVIPAGGLEPVREKTSAREERKSEAGSDPEWAATFKRNVMASTVALAAVIEGPVMTINDVARLRIGSVIELDGDALKRVRIESDDRPVFVGCLGQGRGQFTVLLDDVVMGQRGAPP